MAESWVIKCDGQVSKGLSLSGSQNPSAGAAGDSARQRIPRELGMIIKMPMSVLGLNSFLQEAQLNVSIDYPNSLMRQSCHGWLHRGELGKEIQNTVPQSLGQPSDIPNPISSEGKLFINFCSQRWRSASSSNILRQVRESLGGKKKK